jgi:hypothetical protein
MNRKQIASEAALFKLGAVALAIFDLGADRGLMRKLKQAALEYGKAHREANPLG